VNIVENNMRKCPWGAATDELNPVLFAVSLNFIEVLS